MTTEEELFNTFRLAYYGSNKSLAPELESFRRAYQAILDAEGDGGAVAELVVDRDSGNREWFDIKVFDRTLPHGTKFYTHPARSGVVRDEDVRYLVPKAMRRAWSLGQTYWQQADSESWKQQDKSSDTQRKFDALIEETLAAIQGERHE